MDESLTVPESSFEEARDESNAHVSLSEKTEWLNQTDHYFSDYAIFIDGDKAGEVQLVYVPGEKKLYIEGVAISENYRNKNYGKEIYKMIAGITLPTGRSLFESGVKFVSSKNISEDATRVWRSLEKEGIVHLNEDGVYEFSPPTGANDVSSGSRMPSL